MSLDQRGSLVVSGSCLRGSRRVDALTDHLPAYVRSDQLQQRRVVDTAEVE